MLFLFYYRCYNYGTVITMVITMVIVVVAVAVVLHSPFRITVSTGATVSVPRASCMAAHTPTLKAQHSLQASPELRHGARSWVLRVQDWLNSAAMPDATTGTACSCSKRE